MFRLLGFFIGSLTSVFIILLIIGLPASLVLSWVFDVTSAGDQKNYKMGVHKP